MLVSLLLEHSLAEDIGHQESKRHYYTRVLSLGLAKSRRERGEGSIGANSHLDIVARGHCQVVGRRRHPRR